MYLKCTDADLLVTAWSRSYNKDHLESSLSMLHHPELGTVGVHEKFTFSSVSLFFYADTQGKSWD